MKTGAPPVARTDATFPVGDDRGVEEWAAPLGSAAGKDVGQLWTCTPGTSERMHNEKLCEFRAHEIIHP